MKRIGRGVDDEQIDLSDLDHTYSKENEVSSQHEHQDDTAQKGQRNLDQDRISRGERPEWVEDVPGTESGDSQGGSLKHRVGSERGNQSHGSDEAEVAETELTEEANRLLPLIFAKLEPHLHLPIQPPDPDALAELKRKDAQAHKVWLKEARLQMRHQRFMESARYRMPLKVIRSSQLAALVALLAIIGLAGYALYLNRPWVASILAATDIATIVTIFTDIGRRDKD